MPIDGKTLRKFRASLGLKQKEFAELTQMSLSSLKSYEIGRREFTLEKFKEIKTHLGYSFSDSSHPLRLMIDYLRITFKNVHHIKDFIETYLYVNFQDFTSQETSLMTYNHLYKRGDIWLFDYFDKEERDNYQVTLQLSGQGCRQMELILEREGIIWQDFLAKILYERSDMKVTRIDLALDELYRGKSEEANHFHLSDMINKVYQNYVTFDRLKVWSHIGGGNLSTSSDEEERQGISLYFGSRKSNMFFNFYEKRYEFAQKEGISVEEALEIFGVWNRYEIRLSQGKAHLLVEHFVEGQELRNLARGLINQEMMVYNGVGKYGAYIPDQKWQEMFGSAEPLKLSIKPEPYSIDRTVRWLLYQVSNSLAYVEEADKIMNTEYLKMIQNTGKPTEKMEHELKFLKENYQLMTTT
ncbi:TPA: XRE family transcriptional regulator [Streptococcus agalactiae]|nr:XRE family transcriptional regulator [Streptococcus agalactiae]